MKKTETSQFYRLLREMEAKMYLTYNKWDVSRCEERY